MNYTKSLNDCCINITDGEHCSVQDDINGDFFLLSNKNIINGQIVIGTNERKISLETYNKIHSRTKLEENDILISTVGTLGKTALVSGKINFDFQRSVGIIKCNSSIVNPQYLYYYLNAPTVQKELINKSKGAVQKCLFINDLKEFRINLYELKEQNAIAKVLSSIDDKIALNNKINAQLEQMAKTLYDYWFIQFEFPDGNGGAYKSSNGPMVYNEILKREIPVGWEVKNIDELCDVLTGKEDANFATNNGKYAFFTCGDEILHCDKAVFKGKSILIAGNGNFNVKYYEGEFNAYQRTYVLIPDNEINIGVMYRAMLDSISRFTKGSNGSIVKFITKGDIANTKVLIPSNLDLLKPLNGILSTIEKNKKQNQNLAEMRDWLLPMLMNGQVSIVQP